jgi:hypothetical protein
MAFNIDQFKVNGLQYGGARPALFQVAVSPPPAIGLDLTSTRKFEFTARTATLPEMTVGSVEIPYFGRKIKIAGDRTFNDWGVTVMNDEDFGVRAMFEKWSNAINRMVTNTRQADIIIENYKAAVDVIQYSKDGSIIRSYQIVGAFPTAVEAISLDWDTTNQVETFTVGFAYDYWVPQVEVSGKIAGGINQYSGNI